jgi:uncharacterized membrane protein
VIKIAVLSLLVINNITYFKYSLVVFMLNYKIILYDIIPLLSMGGGTRLPYVDIA